jgi:hypothetical protein
MTYKVLKTIEDKTSDDERSVIQIVEVSSPHVAADFEDDRFVEVILFRFETGWLRLDEHTKYEVTRLLCSCESDHNHGVYYQAPRQMELWEAMFAIGETDGLPVTENGDL